LTRYVPDPWKRSSDPWPAGLDLEQPARHDRPCYRKASRKENLVTGEDCGQIENLVSRLRKE
jgi:hypothetical protein